VAHIWGEPASLWEEKVLFGRDARRLRAWLSSLEALARALLVVMAARLPHPRVRASSSVAEDLADADQSPDGRRVRRLPRARRPGL
jgi:hypothetical protein